MIFRRLYFVYLSWYISTCPVATPIRRRPERVCRETLARHFLVPPTNPFAAGYTYTRGLVQRFFVERAFFRPAGVPFLFYFLIFFFMQRDTIACDTGERGGGGGRATGKEYLFSATTSVTGKRRFSQKGERLRNGSAAAAAAALLHKLCVPA